jgi:hypothetical protein
MSLVDALPQEFRLSPEDVADLTDPFDVKAMAQDLKTLLAICQRAADLGRKPVLVVNRRLLSALGQQWIFPRALLDTDTAEEAL